MWGHNRHRHVDRDPRIAPGVRRVAIHIGANVLTAEHHQHLPAIRGCHDSIARLTRIGRATGIEEYLVLIGPSASRARLAGALDAAAARLDDDGALVVTYTGHSLRGDGPAAATRWCLADGDLAIVELGAMLRCLPTSARVVVVVDSCHAAALARLAPFRQTVIVLAACGEDQWTMNRGRSEFVQRFDACEK